jgi:hypothetical protein
MRRKPPVTDLAAQGGGTIGMGHDDPNRSVVAAGFAEAQFNEVV